MKYRKSFHQNSPGFSFGEHGNVVDSVVATNTGNVVPKTVKRVFGLPFLLKK